MESIARKELVVDTNRLEKEVRANTALYLNDISKENITAFVESTKIIALSVFEKFYFDVDELYAEGALKLHDETKLNAFSDFHDGYRAKMRAWADQNKMFDGERGLDKSLEMPRKEDNVSRKSIAVGGIGTFLVVGLAIAGVKVWSIVLAELLVLASASYLYKTKKAQSESDFKKRLKEYEEKVNAEKTLLVNSVISDLKKWLEDAQAYSDHLLTSYGIN